MERTEEESIAADWAAHETSPGWYSDCTPDTSSSYAYTIMIRGEDDPERPKRGTPEHARMRWPHLKLRGTIEEYADALLEHMRDGAERTFNRLCVEMHGVTADIAPDNLTEALWRLTVTGEVEFTNRAPILFRLRKEK